MEIHEYLNKLTLLTNLINLIMVTYFIMQNIQTSFYHLNS